MRHYLLALTVLLCGCNVKAAIDKQAAKQAEEKAAQPAPVAPVRPKPADPPRDKGIIGQTTDDVVDYQKAMAENPNLVEVELKAGGSDYLSFLMSAHINVGAKMSMLGMEHQLNIIKNVEGRNPTYSEIMKIMKDNHIKFKMPPSYRKYAYDAKRGVFVVLEDPAKQAEVHGEKE
jgi:hypothetical protein